MTALEDVPEDGAAAQRAGHPQSANPLGFSSPEGIEWARAWGMAEVASRRSAGTYGATDDDYRAGGLKPPERSSSGAPSGVIASGIAYLLGPGGSVVGALGTIPSFAALYRDAVREAEASARAMHYAAAMQDRIIGSASFRWDPGAVAALYGVPSSILGFGPVVSIVDEPKPAPSSSPAIPLEWRTTKRKELVDGAVNADPKDAVLRRYLLDPPSPLEVRWGEPYRGGLLDPRARLEALRATMAEPRPMLRPPKDAPLGRAPAPRPTRSRKRQP